MNPFLMKSVLKKLICLSLFAQLSAQAATVRIGNGDEGSDLEGFTELTSGRIPEARKAAVELLQKLNVPGVRGLGTLLPEVESTKLYLTKKDSDASQPGDRNQFHSDMKGRVYARTFAEPHAATRFFPVAEKLDADQLIALHVHEGLHRSLPASVREDEAVVSEITLAITAPGANFDGILKVVKKLLPEEAPVMPSVSQNAPPPLPVPETARAKYPSLFGYEFRSFRNPQDDTSTFPISAMHILRTELYPFEIQNEPLGLGLEFSMIKNPTAMLMGPLQLSGQLRIWTFRGFDVGVWATAGLNTLSNNELKQSQFGRDAYQLGISIKKDLKLLSVENFLSYLAPGQTSEQVGNVNYKYDYGAVITASTHPALLLGNFRLGGFLELMLGEHYRVSGGAFNYDPGRYRLVSVGPEIQYRYENVVFGISGRYLIDSTQDANYDVLGNLMGPGVAQGNVAAQISVFF